MVRTTPPVHTPVSLQSSDVVEFVRLNTGNTS